MAGETFVDVTYRGIELGRRLRLTAADPGAAYLHCNTPMPLGTEIAVLTESGHTVPLRVLETHEQIAGAGNPPGMRVTALGLAGEARRWWQNFAAGPGDTAPAGELAEGAESQGEDQRADDAGQAAADAPAASELEAAAVERESPGETESQVDAPESSAAAPESAAQESAAQESAAQESAAQESAAQESAAQDPGPKPRQQRRRGRRKRRRDKDDDQAG